MASTNSAGGGPLAVRGMTPDEYATWSREAPRSYAADLSAASGQSLDSAIALAQALFAKLLPQGLETANTWLLHVLDEGGRTVGVLWIGPNPERPGVAHIFRVEIYEAYQGRGLGRAAMAAAEQIATEAGITDLTLSVFGNNLRARHLYDSLGYRAIATQMIKPLTGG